MSTRRAPRVVMVVENNGYPSDERVRYEALALTDAGYDVSVIAPAEDGQPRREIVDGVKVLRYPPGPRGEGALSYLVEYAYATAVSLVLVIRAMVTRGLDVIHLHNPPDTLWIAAVPAKLLGRRMVFDHHDLVPEMYEAIYGSRGSRWLRWALLLMERITFRLADHVISTNESYREIAINRGHVPASRTSIVRNGPDLDRVRSVPPDPSVRARARIIIGYVGLMARQDGLDHLLRAAHDLVHELGRRDVLFMLIGYGDALEDLKRMARELDLEQHVWFTGRISDDETFRRYLCAADICVTPDPWSPYADRSTMIKNMEYMALGKPIVAFDLRENRASAQDAAVYVGGNDHHAFARALADLMDDPERRERLGRIGRERVESALSWDHSIPGLLAAYQTVLGR